jgi:hypothetical protein
MALSRLQAGVAAVYAGLNGTSPEIVLRWLLKGAFMDDKIYADPTEPAALRYGDASVECATLGEAVLEWHRLPAEKQARATIKVANGTVYNASGIDRLHASK